MENQDNRNDKSSQKDESTEKIISEVEYNTLLNNIAQKMVDKMNAAGGQGKADLGKIGVKVREEEKENFEKLFQFIIVTKGILDADKVEKIFQRDLKDKVIEKISGQSLQKTGGIGLLVILIPVVIIWVVIPGSIHWGIKTLLSVIACGLAFWGFRKYLDNKAKLKND